MIRKLERIIYKHCSNNRRIRMLRKKGCKIGENCEIYPSVDFGSEPYLVEIGNCVRITDDVKITTHDGGIWVLRNNGMAENGDRFGRVKVGNNVHIGTRSIIMPGVTIGDNVIIGAGSIVTKDIAQNSVAVGIPARVIESIDIYYKKNSKSILFTKKMSTKQKKDYLQSLLNNDNE